MAPNTPRAGRLIALDGSRGADLGKSANRLVEALQARGVDGVVSRWDASGLFGELSQAGDRATVSPRTLSLVYAADLAFRLRWEIRPALEAGVVVIAAPYVETAAAFGAGCGLPEQWLRELLRFAPRPDLQALARERKLDRAWKPRFDRGYPEFCAALLSQAPPRLLSKQARAAVIAALEQPRGRRLYPLAGDGLDRAVKGITRSLRGAASLAPSRPRIARR